MTGVRMSLEEAGKALGGLHPNTVRNRAKNGKIPFEKDNSGKWWVFIDLEKAANDAKERTSNSPTLKPKNVSDFRHFEATITALSCELEAVRAERNVLRDRASDADRLDAMRIGMEAQISVLTREAERVRKEAAEAVADARKERDIWWAEAQKWQEQAAQAMQQIVEQHDRTSSETPAAGQGKPVGGFWARLWGKRTSER